MAPLIKKFQKQTISPTDAPHEVINRVQDSIKATTDAIVNNPVVQGQLLQGLKFVVGQETPVNHKLGRTIQGWHLSRTQTLLVGGYPASISFTEDLPKSTSTTIYLTAASDAPTTVDLTVTTDLYVY